VTLCKIVIGYQRFLKMELHEPLKHWYPNTKLHDIKTQIWTWIFTAVKISNPVDVNQVVNRC